MTISASRCVLIVRRAGKSPPGAPRYARPRRASNGPSSSTDPRKRPTSAPSGSSLTTSGQQIRSVVLPIPSTSAPRSSSSRAITSTSLMRGTFVSTHASVVSRHAASSGSAAFLLPSTSTDPDRRWPPSMTSVDIELPEVNDLFAQRDAELFAHRHTTPFDQHANVTGGGMARVDDEVAVRRRDAGASNRHTLESGSIHERAGRLAVRILENAARARCVERLRFLAIRERLTCGRSQRGRIARRHTKGCRQQDLAARLQAAAIVSEYHFGDRHLSRHAVARRDADSRDVLAD